MCDHFGDLVGWSDVTVVVFFQVARTSGDVEAMSLSANAKHGSILDEVRFPMPHRSTSSPNVGVMKRAVPALIAMPKEPVKGMLRLGNIIS